MNTTSNAEEQANTAAAANAQPPKATKRASVAPRKPRVAPGKPRSGKKASSAERRPKSQKAAKQAKPAGAREGSKAAKVISLLRRPDGASLKELMKATGWLAHSVRGFLSGIVAKRMGLDLVSRKSEDGSDATVSKAEFSLPNPNSAAGDSPFRRFLVQYPPGHNDREHCDKSVSCAHA